VRIHTPAGGQNTAPKPACVLEPPEWLGEHGSTKWNEIIADLAASNPIVNLDRDCLALYCEAHDELHKARATLDEAGCDECVGPNGALYPHPAVGQKNKAIERIRKFGRELGINRCVRKAPKKSENQPQKVKPA